MQGAEKRTRVQKTLSLMGVTIHVCTSPSTTGTQQVVLDYSMPANFPGPILHWHKQAHEWFYVTEGSVAFDLGASAATVQRRVLGKGDFILVPPYTVHKFSNPSGEPARMLIGFDQGRMDEYFEELFELVRTSKEWPPKDPAPVEALAEKYDTYSPAKL